MSFAGVKVKQEKPDPPPAVPGPSKASRPKAGGSSAAAEPSPENLVIFEKRMLELAKEFPEGISEKILQSDMPSITGAERAVVINKLLSKGMLDLYKKGTELQYRIKTATVEPEQIKGADKEEKAVYDIIKDANNKGIWIRDIRLKSNLTMTQLNKIVKSLETKRLIKAVKSVAATKKKVYMLYELEPHRSLSGGAWYSDTDFESEFVAVLNRQCLRYLVDMREKAKSQPMEFGYKAKRAIALTKLEDIWKFISNLGISKVELSPDDISNILETLIYDGKVEKILKGDDTFYIAIEPLYQDCGIIQVPCGVCPVAKDCSERGSVNPTSCIYIPQWLEAEF